MVEEESEIRNTLMRLLHLASAPHMQYKATKEHFRELFGRLPMALSASLETILEEYWIELKKSLFANKEALFPGGDLESADLPRVSELWLQREQNVAEYIVHLQKLPPFPSKSMKQCVEDFLAQLPESEQARVNVTLTPVIDILNTFSGGTLEYLRQLLCKLVHQYCVLEEAASSRTSLHLAHVPVAADSSSDGAAKEWGGWGPPNTHLNLAFFKNPQSKAAIVVIDVLKALQSLDLTEASVGVLSRASRLYGKESLEVSLVARQMLIKTHSPPDVEREKTLVKELGKLLVDDVHVAQPSVEKGKEDAESSAPSDGLRRSPSRESLNFTSVLKDTNSQDKMHQLITSPEPMVDIILHVFSTMPTMSMRKALLELYIHRLYRAYEMQQIEFLNEESKGHVVVWASFSFRSEQNYHPVTPSSATAVHSDLQSSLTTSSDDTEACSNISEDSVLQDDILSPEVQPLRRANVIVLQQFQDIIDNFTDLLSTVSKNCNATSLNVVHFVILAPTSPRMREERLSKNLSEFFGKHLEILSSAGVSRITVTIQNTTGDQPDCYTFFSSHQFKEYDLMRHIEPTLGYRLELDRMSNYHVRYVPTGSRTSSTFFAEDRKRKSDARLFVRTLVRGNTDSNEILESNRLFAVTEQRLAECIKRLDMVLSRKQYAHAVNNHIFLRILPTISYEPEALRAIIEWLGDRYGKRLFKLKVSDLELRCKLAVTSDTTQTIPVLFQVKNPTAFKFDVFAYVEARDAVTGKGTLVGLDGLGLKVGPLHGKPTKVPYEGLSVLQRKRYFCQQFETAYAYDYLELLNLALDKQWNEYSDELRAIHAEPERRDDFLDAMKSPDPYSTTAVEEEERISVRSLLEMAKRKREGLRKPKELTYHVELILDSKTMSLVPVVRENGENDVGMVAWLVHMYTPEFPESDTKAGKQVWAGFIRKFSCFLACFYS